MRSEEEIRDRLDAVEDSLDADPVYDDEFASRKDNPKAQIAKTLQWVLEEEESDE